MFYADVDIKLLQSDVPERHIGIHSQDCFILDQDFFNVLRVKACITFL